MNRLPLMRRVAVAVSARRSSVGGGVHRHFASADRIRSSISKLMENQQEANLHHDATAASELHASLEALRNQLNEAAQCVNDCKQQDGEIVEAEQALDRAVVCLVEVLETKMQYPTDKFVKQIRELRDELETLQKQQQQPMTTTTSPSNESSVA